VGVPLADPAVLEGDRLAAKVEEILASKRQDLGDLTRYGVDRDWWGGLSGMRVMDAPEERARFEALARELQAENVKVYGWGDRTLDALASGEAALIEHDGKLCVIPVAKGGGPGSGAIYMRNLPAPGSYTINPLLFMAKTQKNRKLNPQIAHPGYGLNFGFRADAVGILSRLILFFEGTGTSPATAPIATRGWPWMFARTITVSANGINNLIACDGLDARVLLRVRNTRLLFDRESTFAIPAATGSATVRIFYEIPLAYDESLIGAVFAQTEETFLNLQVLTGAAADLFTVAGNALTWANANWRVMTEFYSIPISDSKAGRVLVLPDITQLHGVVSRDDALPGTGDHVAPLTRTGGILLRSLQRFDNSTTDFGNLDPAGTAIGGQITSHRFRYGGNVVPLELTGPLARFQNETDYGDAILPSSDAVSGGNAAAYLVDDFVNDSPIRDVIHMAGITEAQLINTIAASVTVVAGAKVHTVQEAMVAG
jgi:hypothetical protein